MDFPSIEDLSLAARCWLQVYENYQNGSLDITGKRHALDNAALLPFSIGNLGRLQYWSSWYDDGMTANIHGCKSELAKFDLSIPGLLQRALPEDDEGDSAARHRLQRKRFHFTTRKALSTAKQYLHIERMRHKLARWEIPGLPGRIATRCCRMLQSLHGCVPPRVCSAIWRTLFNGWCTGRRFQKLERCCFRCNSWIQEDSIEHYAGCSVVKEFARKKLNIRPSTWSRGLFVTLGAHEGWCDRATLARRALWVYATYKAHNTFRYTPLATDTSPLHVLGQFAVEGTLGHAYAAQCLDGAYCSVAPAEFDAAAFAELDIFV